MKAPDDNIAELDGLGQLKLMLASGSNPPFANTLGFELVDIEEGYAVFEGEPGHSLYNLTGSVHGGYASTLLDSACGCAVHTRLSPEQAYTTIELKMMFHRPLNDESGVVRAEGRLLSFGRRIAFAEAKLTDGRNRLCASATSSLLIFDK